MGPEIDGITTTRHAPVREKKTNGAVHNDIPPALSPDEYGHNTKNQPKSPVSFSGIPLGIEDWLARDLPPQEFLLGQVFSTTSRMILNAATGIGKTNFGMSKFAHLAAGKDFLHWHCSKARRVVFIDGEMSRRLLLDRAQEIARRVGKIEPGMLCLLSKEDVEGFPPLNTEAGHAAIYELIDEIKRRYGGPPEAICFDNIMSLIIGDMKEEESWRHTLPLVKELTKRRIGQLWIHHTGHDTTRGYGTKTREWEMDTVAHLEEEKRPETDLSFKLSFPKARERSAANRADFAETIIALVNDQWESKAATDAKGKVDGLALKFLDALRDAVIGGNAKMYGCPAAAIELWKTTCIKKGLIDPKSKDNAMRAMLSKYKLKLIQANHIACNDTLAWLLP